MELLDVVLADDAAGDAMVLELRANPEDIERFAVVVQIGVEFERLRGIISYAPWRLGASGVPGDLEESVRDVPVLARASSDIGRAGVEFVADGSGEVLTRFCRDSSDGRLHVRAVRETEGIVRVANPADVGAGASEAMADRFEWRSQWDARTGWLRVVSPDGSGTKGVEICDRVVVTVENGRIRSVWLKPSTTPTLR